MTIFERGLPHLVYLAVLLPVVGVFLIAALSRTGAETIKRAALSNGLLTLAVTLLCILVDDPRSAALREADPGNPAAEWRFVTEFPWLSTAFGNETDGVTGWDSRVSLGIDGAGLWTLPSLSLLYLLAIGAAWTKPPERPALFFGSLCTLHAGLLLSLCAVDGLLLIVGLQLATLATTLLLAGWGPERGRRKRVMRVFLWQQAGILTIWLGLLGLSATELWLARLHERTSPMMFSLLTLPNLMRGFALSKYEAGLSWNGASFWITLTLLLGIWMRLGLCPFHNRRGRSFAEAHPSLMILEGGGGMLLVIPLLLRLVLPFGTSFFFAPGGEPSTGLLVFRSFAAIGAVLLALRVTIPSDWGRQTFEVGQTVKHLSLFGLLSLTEAGIVGAVLLLIGHALASGMGLWMVSRIEERYHTRDPLTLGGLGGAYPKLGKALALIAWLLVGGPLTIGFVGGWELLSGVMDDSLTTTILVLAVVVLTGWGVIANLSRLVSGKLVEPEMPEGILQIALPPLSGEGEPSTISLGDVQRIDPHDLTRSELAFLVPIAIAVFLVGIWPSVILSEIVPQAMRLLDLLRPVIELGSPS